MRHFPYPSISYLLAGEANIARNIKNNYRTWVDERDYFLAKPSVIHGSWFAPASIKSLKAVDRYSKRIKDARSVSDSKEIDWILTHCSQQAAVHLAMNGHLNEEQILRLYHFFEENRDKFSVEPLRNGQYVRILIQNQPNMSTELLDSFYSNMDKSDPHKDELIESLAKHPNTPETIKVVIGLQLGAARV